jgi:hypothetical protein
MSKNERESHLINHSTDFTNANFEGANIQDVQYVTNPKNFPNNLNASKEAGTSWLTDLKNLVASFIPKQETKPEIVHRNHTPEQPTWEQKALAPKKNEKDPTLER